MRLPPPHLSFLNPENQFPSGLGPDPGPRMYPLNTYCVPGFLHESSHFIIIFVCLEVHISVYRGLLLHCFWGQDSGLTHEKHLLQCFEPSPQFEEREVRRLA